MDETWVMTYANIAEVSEPPDGNRSYLKMAEPAESEANPRPILAPPVNIPGLSGSKTLEQATPWIDYAFQQALLYQKIAQETVNSTIEASKSQLARIAAASSDGLSKTIESGRDVKSQFEVYEDIFFSRINEGINIGTSHPLIAGSMAAGVGLLGLKKTRSFLYYSTMRIFSSEEAMLSRAEKRVKELKQSLDSLKAENSKVERIAAVAEDELFRGRTKLKQAGKQIQTVVRAAYKIERQAAGLKDILGDLPRREASQFRKQVSDIGGEAKRERNGLIKQVSKISNYGISV